MKKVSIDQATKDFEKWLEARRINERKRESNKTYEETLIGGIMDGNLIVNEDATLTQILVFPTADGEGVKELVYSQRLNAGQRQAATKGVDAKDGEGRLIGYVAALTNQPLGVIKKIESGDDYDIATSIAVYFL